MELRIQIDTSQILSLIHQLPKKEIIKLSTILQSELSEKKQTKGLRKLILNAPVWNASDVRKVSEARKLINKSRVA